MRVFLIALMSIQCGLLAAESGKPELLSAKEYWFLFEDARTLQDNVVAIKKYIEQVAILKQQKDLSEKDSQLLSSLSDAKSLDKVKKEILAVRTLYKDDPTYNPDGRLADLKALERALDYVKTLLGEPDSSNTKGETIPPKPDQIVPRRATDEEVKELTAFIAKISKLIGEEKYIEVARNDFDYQQQIPDDAWAKVLPDAIAKLKKQVKHGGLDLLQALLVEPKMWFVADDGKAILYNRGKRLYTHIRCSKDKSGRWLLQSICSGIPSELAEVDLK